MIGYFLCLQHFFRFDLECFGQRDDCSGFYSLEYCFDFFYIEKNLLYSIHLINGIEDDAWLIYKIDENEIYRNKSFSTFND